MATSADPDQLASSEANWSGSTLFAKAGYSQVQQDKGYILSSLLFIACRSFIIDPDLMLHTAVSDIGLHWILTPAWLKTPGKYRV